MCCYLKDCLSYKLSVEILCVMDIKKTVKELAQKQRAITLKSVAVEVDQLKFEPKPDQGNLMCTVTLPIQLKQRKGGSQHCCIHPKKCMQPHHTKQLQINLHHEISTPIQ